jgi:CRISPR/Cas system-associated exonuclease Cas4 (RecB family)
LGIHFVDVIPRRGEMLAEVIGEIEGAAAAKAATEALKKSAAEEQGKREVEAQAQRLEQQRAKELAGREAREWVEIQEMAQRAKAAQGASALQMSAPSPAPVKRDRRAQVRLGVDTTATIYLIKIGSAARGHILDLSLGGCRIRGDERFPVGIYTRAEAEFRLEGLPFRLGGVIQAIHDRYTVGIRFLDMSERKREQLEQLIAEIEESKQAHTEPAVAGKEAVGSQG